MKANDAAARGVEKGRPGSGAALRAGHLYSEKPNSTLRHPPSLVCGHHTGDTACPGSRRLSSKGPQGPLRVSYGPSPLRRDLGIHHPTLGSSLCPRPSLGHPERLLALCEHRCVELSPRAERHPPRATPANGEVQGPRDRHRAGFFLPFNTRRDAAAFCYRRPPNGLPTFLQPLPWAQDEESEPVRAPRWVQAEPESGRRPEALTTGERPLASLPAASSATDSCTTWRVSVSGLAPPGRRVGGRGVSSPDSTSEAPAASGQLHSTHAQRVQAGMVGPGPGFTFHGDRWVWTWAPGTAARRA